MPARILALLALLVPATAAAGTNVTAGAGEVSTFLGGRTGKLVYVDANEAGKCYWIDLSDMSVHQLSGDENCKEPLLSPDGTRVVYGLCNIISKWPGESQDNEGDAYIRALSGGSRHHVAGPAVAGKESFSPHWWIDPASGDEHIVSMDYYEKDKQTASGRATWKQRIVGNEPQGNPVKILEHAFDGGLSRDGTVTGEAYHYLHTAQTMDLGGGNGTDISPRLDGGNQACNSSMSPDNDYYLMHLRIDHEGCNIESGQNLVATIWKPDGAAEMQNPEYSTHPDYSTFTAEFGGSYYMYIANTQTGESLKIAEGDFSVPHLWVASETVTMTLDPTSLAFEALEGGNQPASQDVAIGNAGSDTLDTVTVAESVPWLTVSRAGSGNDQTLTNVVDISGLAPDVYTGDVEVTCANASNSPRSFTVTLTVNSSSTLASIDVEPASVTILPSTTVDLTATPRDQRGDPFPATITWSVDGGGSMAPGDTDTSTFTSDGTEGAYTVTASSGGISGTAAVNVEAGADVEPPTVAITVPVDGATVSGPLNLEGTAADNEGLSLVEIRFDGGTWNTATGTSSWSFLFDTGMLSDGAHTVTARATDTSTNTASASVGISVDNGSSGPSVTVFSPQAGDVWEVGSVQHIRWETVQIDDVTLRFSSNGGANWENVEITVDKSKPEWMDYPWTVPDVPSTDCQIMVSGYNQEADGVSGAFTIRPPGQVDEGDLVIQGSCGCRTSDPSTAWFLGFLLIWMVCRRASASSA